jgi:hypothetical protein
MRFEAFDRDSDTAIAQIESAKGYAVDDGSRHRCAALNP